jgi:hypothetical protein
MWPQTPSGVALGSVPVAFENTLLEIVDRHSVSIRLTNLIGAWRVMCVVVHGWIEPMTEMGETVFH